LNANPGQHAILDYVKADGEIFYFVIIF